MKKFTLFLVSFCVAACAGLPTSGEYLVRAKGYLQDGKPQQALKAYNKAIALNPNLLEAYGARGAAHFFAGNYALAQADFELILRNDPYQADAYTALGSALAAQGEYEKALEMMNIAIALKPSRPENFTSRAGVYFMLGRYEEALADYSAVLAYYPAADVYESRAAVYEKMGRTQEAQQDLDAIKTKPMPPSLAVYNAGK